MHAQTSWRATSSQQNYHVANRESRFLEPLFLSDSPFLPLPGDVREPSYTYSLQVACWSLVLAPNNGTRSSSKSVAVAQLNVTSEM